MINGNSVLAIIPARGGSKSIPRKNIKILAGKPLIAWTIEEAKKSKYIDRLIISSEDKEIIAVAKKFGCEVPFIRPLELSQDDTPTIEAVIHAINTIPEQYDYICLLQPTSPLRKSNNIDECIEKCISKNAKSCVSVTRVDKTPYWMFEIDKNDKLKSFFSDIDINKNRQQLPDAFVLNGAVYVACTSQLISEKKYITENTLSYIMDKNISIDIDDLEDWKNAERKLEK